MANEIGISAAFSRPVVYALAGPQLLYLVIDIQPGTAAAGERLPLNFGLVLDKSASMRGEPMRCLCQAVKELIDWLEPDDVISITTFDTRSRVVVPAQPAREKEALKRQVDSIAAGSGTQMSPGMRSGLEELGKHLGQRRLNRMVLLTDGRTTNEKACLNRADEAARQEVPIIALGLGTGWNEDLLQEIGTRTGGRADYIVAPHDIEPIFQEVWQRLQVVACNLTLELGLADGVECRAVWQVSPDIQGLSQARSAGRSVSVPLPELDAGGQTLVVELVIPGRPAGQFRLVQAKVAYDVPQRDIRGEKAGVDLVVQYTPDPYAAQAVLPRAAALVERLTAYRLQQKALADQAAGNLISAVQKLRSAAAIWQRIGEAELARTYLAEAERLEQQGRMSEQGRKTIMLQSGKTRRLDGLL